MRIVSRSSLASHRSTKREKRVAKVGKRSGKEGETTVNGEWFPIGIDPLQRVGKALKCPPSFSLSRSNFLSVLATSYKLHCNLSLEGKGWRRSITMSMRIRNEKIDESEGVRGSQET